MKSTKGYRYGCKIPPKDVQEQIEAQLFLAHQYRLQLWRLACAARELYRERRREFFPRILELEGLIEGCNQIIEGHGASPELRLEARQQRKVHKAEWKALSDAAKADPHFQGLVAQDRDREWILRRALRKVFSRTLGLYSGTYLCVEDADKRARADSKHNPSRPVWRKTGVLGIQLQGGRTKMQVESGADPSIHVIVPPKNPNAGRKKNAQITIRYRVRSDRKGHAVLVDMPAMMDRRPLPDDARVTWAKLVVGKSGNRLIYSVQLTIESEHNARQEFGAGEVAVCLEGDCILYAGEGEWAQPLLHDPRLARVAALQSTRDKLRNAMLAKVEAWAEAEDGYKRLRESFRFTANARERRRQEQWIGLARQPGGWHWHALESNKGEKASCQRAAAFVGRLMQEVRLPDELRQELKAWVKKEDHLYQWQSDMRTNALIGRREAYRVFAANLRRKYRYVLLDNRRLDRPERKTEEVNSQAFDELRLAIRNSFSPEYAVGVTGETCEEMFNRWREDGSPKPEGKWSVAARKARTNVGSEGTVQP